MIAKLMYSLLVFGCSACHYKVCSPFLSPGQEWNAGRLRGKEDGSKALSG